MGLNSTEVSYGFSQLGNAFLKGTAAYVPPAGKVVVAVQVVSGNATFATLTPDTSGYVDADGTTGANLEGTTAFIGTTKVDANGTNAEVIPNDYLFARGTVLFGRFTAVTLGSSDDAVILHFGPTV